MKLKNIKECKNYTCWLVKGVELPFRCVVLGSRSIYLFGCCLVNSCGGLITWVLWHSGSPEKEHHAKLWQGVSNCHLWAASLIQHLLMIEFRVHFSLVYSCVLYSCHPTTFTALPHHHVTVLHFPTTFTTSPRHHVTQSFDLPPATPPHLPHYCVSQSFDLPAATPPHLPHHRITQSFDLPPATPPHLLLYHISQSFDLPPATPPHLLHHCVTALPHHRITTSLCHCITASLREIFPTTLVWIWLVNTMEHSSDWLIVPTTANQAIRIEKT